MRYSPSASSTGRATTIESIAGRQNDARIAGNHALLAAAFEQMAAYLGTSGPRPGEAAEEFATVDVAGMVAASVGSAEEDQGSAVFLEALRALLDWGRVRFESRRAARAGEKDRGAVVGRIIAGGPSDGGIRSSSCRWPWRCRRCSGRCGSRASRRCR